MAVRLDVATVGPGRVERAVVVDGDRALDEVVHAVAVRRQALAAARAGRRRDGPEGLEAEVVADLRRFGPAGGIRAVRRSRALDHQVLVDAGLRRVAVAEGDVDRPVLADDRMRALILVAGIGVGLTAGRCAKDGARAADLDSRRPGRAAVGRLAEVDRAVSTDALAGVGEPRPRHVHVVRLRAR